MILSWQDRQIHVKKGNKKRGKWMHNGQIIRGQRLLADLQS